MANVQFDCELMLQPLPEKLLTDAESFHVLQDDQGRPIIICVAANQSLLMVAPDDLGQNQVVNLSEKLRLPSVVKSLAAAQDHANKNKIYIAVATQEKSDMASHLHILKPFKIESGRWWENLDWPSLLMKPMGEPCFEIHRILLASRCYEGQEFPFLAAETSVPGVPRHNVSRIEVDTTKAQWQWDNFPPSLPFDVSKLDGLCVASSPVTSGLVFLDKTQDKPTVTFTDLRSIGGITLSFNLPILPNPTSIATLKDPDGASNILIAGDGGILHVPAQDWIESVKIGTTRPPTLSHPAFEGAHELRVAQNGLSSTIWAINGDGNVVGQTAELKPREGDEEIFDLHPTGLAVPLFPTYDAVRHFEAIMDAASGRQELFVLKTGGSVVSFAQAGDSKLWSSSDFKIPDAEEVEDVSAYTCQVRCLDAQGASLANTEVLVSTSSQVRCAINGEIVYLSQVPRPAQTDEGGSLTILLPSNDLSVPTLTVKGADLPETSFRPADKAIKKLSALARNGQLQNARNKDGTALFPNLNDEALKTIGRLHDTYQQKQESWSDGDSFGAANTWANSDWSFLHGLVAGVEKVVEFACEAGRFIVNTAKKAWAFVVKTAEQALKAISSVFEWIGAKIEDAIAWLAEQLDWESIMDVQLFMKSFVLKGMDCVDDLLVMGNEKLDGWLEQAEREVATWHTPPELPASLANQRLQTDLEKGKDKKEMTNNPLCKWTESKLQDKQVRKSMEDNNGSHHQDMSLSKVFEAFFEKVLKPLWDTMGETSRHMWDDLKKLFDSGSSVTPAEVFKNVGVDLLLGIIQILRKSAGFLLDLVTQILRSFRSLLNEKLNIWVLTKVYKKMSGGQDLTILNLATLVLAVPATYLFKLISLGKKPRDVPAFAELLAELRSSFGSSSFTIEKLEVTPNGLSSDSAIVKSDHAFSGFEKGYGSTWGKEHAATTVKKMIDGNSNFSTFIRICRGGKMVISCAMPLWTIVDTILTAKSWPTALDPEPLPGAYLSSVYMRFKPTVGLVAWIIASAGSMPIEKTNLKRNPKTITMRWCLWFGKSYFNFVKLRSPEHLKPQLCGLIAMGDIGFYSIIVWAERKGEETDTVLEILQRFLENGWALGSWYNCVTRAQEPWGYRLALAAGAVMATGNTVAAVAHVAYWMEHSEDEDYKPPSWSNSLSGSLW